MRNFARVSKKRFPSSMSKAKYRYNPKTLTYEKAELGFQGKVIQLFSYIGMGLGFAAIFVFVFFTFFDSPKEKKLIRENDQLKLQYGILDKRMNEMNAVLDNLAERDNTVYRSIFEAEPIANSVRKAGFGGVNRYKNLEGYENSEVVIDATEKMDQLAKQMYIQSKSLDEVYKLAREKEKMLASIPAIMPISNKDLTRFSSGFGMRYHPILKIMRPHNGMDFTAPIGSEIYSTGDGVIEKVDYNRGGFGKYVVVNHGYGYKTIYAHMSKQKVRRGQKVKRGDVLGLIGNTGLSSGPHLHYEVVKDGRKVNPASFYSNDLSPEEYELMIQLSSQVNQSFD